MAKSVLLTSLSAMNNVTLRYYSAKKEFGYDYCEAFMDTEASTKYLLAHYKIDEIIVIGGESACDTRTDLEPVPLKNGRNYYSADKSDLTTYALFQYRLAQYLDELTTEQETCNALLPEETRKKLADFIQKYQQEADELESRRLDRLFDELSCSAQKYEKLEQAILAAFPEMQELSALYMRWVKNYLYMALKPSAKMELLQTNENASIRFVPTDTMSDRAKQVNSMMSMNQSVTEGADDIDLYVAFNSEDAADTFVAMNLLDIMTALPQSNVRCKKIFTVSSPYKNLNAEICDSTNVFDVSKLAAGIQAFLNYGKADKIVEIWERSGGQDKRVSGMIYAIRRVDMGLSMCNMQEVEKGILRLRELFRSDSRWNELSYEGALFNVIAESIKKDYGVLLEGDGEIPFIDLLKWAYRHQFYQQTLTLIESKVPDQLVNSGIFYYCGDEGEAGHVTELFAQQRLLLKPFESHKMDDINYYFIKYYDRGRVARGRDKDIPEAYAALRTKSVENKNPNLISGRTACDNMQTLHNLLYAYYHVCIVRNKINHADAAAMAEQRLSVLESDESSALIWLKDSVNFFIKSYEAAMKELEGKTPHVVLISSDEVRKAEDRIKFSRPKPGTQTEKA